MPTTLVRTSLVFVVTAALLAPAGAQPARAPRPPLPALAPLAPEAGVQRHGRHEEVERFTRTLATGRAGEITLGNIAGDITVRAGGERDAVLEVVKRGFGRSPAEARRQIDLVEVEILERGGRAEVRARYAGGERHHRVAVDYIVTAPAETRVSARSVSGGLRIAGMKGEIRAESVSGDVGISDGVRITTAKSVSGDVEITDIEMDGEMSASSISGNLVVRRVKARGVDVSTVSGDVILDDLASVRADVRSVSGSIRYRGDLAPRGRYELKSHSGDVRVLIGEAVGFEIDATTFSGSVSSAFPLTLRAGDREGEPGRQRRHGRTVRGVYGDGSAFLSVTSFSGTIVLARP